MKTTPGPWEVREVDGLFAIAHKDGWVLESDNVNQDRVDARLISAAPELLDACKLAFHACQDNLRMYAYKNEQLLVEAFDACRKAIEKAGRHEIT